MANACAGQFKQCKTLMAQIQEFNEKNRKLESMGPPELLALLELDRRITGGPPSALSKPIATRAVTAFYLKATNCKSKADWGCAVDYAKTRVQFSRPIAGYQLVQAKFADMLTEITKAQLVAWRLGKLKEAKKMRPDQVSLAKRNNVKMALECARNARDLLGANGITDEYQSGRHMCNLESVFTYEGTDHIHTLIVGEDITGSAAF